MCIHNSNIFTGTREAPLEWLAGSTHGLIGFLLLILFFHKRVAEDVNILSTADRTGMWRKHSQEESWKLFQIHLYLWEINEKAGSLLLKAQDSSLQRLVDFLSLFFFLFSPEEYVPLLAAATVFFFFQLVELQACCLFRDKVKNNSM